MMAPKAAIERSYTLALWPSAPAQVTGIAGTDLLFKALPVLGLDRRRALRTEGLGAIETYKSPLYHYVAENLQARASNCTLEPMVIGYTVTVIASQYLHPERLNTSKVEGAGFVDGGIAGAEVDRQHALDLTTARHVIQKAQPAPHTEVRHRQLSTSLLHSSYRETLMQTSGPHLAADSRWSKSGVLEHPGSIDAGHFSQRELPNSF